MIESAEWANEYGENILYAAGLLQGRVQDASHSSSKILCKDASRDIQRTTIAVNTLPFAQKRAVHGWYCTDIFEDGRVPTTGQIAMKLRTSRASFELDLEAGEKKVLCLLTACR